MIRYTNSIQYSKKFLGFYVKPELIKDLSYKKLEQKRLMKKKNKTDQGFLLKSREGDKE